METSNATFYPKSRRRPKTKVLYPCGCLGAPEENFLKVAMRIVVGIATAGRSVVLSEALSEIAKQPRLPECVIICPSVADDVEHELLKTFPYPIKIVSGALGTSSQRNAILRATNGEDAIVFFDDDFFSVVELSSKCRSHPSESSKRRDGHWHAY